VTTKKTRSALPSNVIPFPVRPRLGRVATFDEPVGPPRPELAKALIDTVLSSTPRLDKVMKTPHLTTRERGRVKGVVGRVQGRIEHVTREVFDRVVCTAGQKDMVTLTGELVILSCDGTVEEMIFTPEDETIDDASIYDPTAVTRTKTAISAKSSRKWSFEVRQ